MLEDILRTLEDGRWHDFMKFASEKRISEDDVLLAVKFLNEYGFVKLDEKGKRVKLDPEFLKLPV